MKAAINKQLDWAGVEILLSSIETHMKEHMQECDILGLMDINKMVQARVSLLAYSRDQ